MWKIKDLPINGRAVLAPMAGITTLSYRNFYKPFGVALSYTEMVSDMGLIHNNSITYTYLESSHLDHPLAIQLFGGSKETLVEAIKIIENGNYNYDVLDINLGCPVPKVTKAGAGSAWLKRPKELFDAMEAVVKASTKPVTAKIRLGWDVSTINFLEVIEGLEKAGVAMIALHLRTRAELYSGKVDYEIARDLGRKMRVPLVISGDIYSLDQAISAIEITGASAVMLARGAMGNPHLVKQIDHYYKTGERLAEATLAEQISYMRTYAKMLVEQKGEQTAVKMLRGILPKFLNHYPFMKEYKMILVNKIVTYADIESVLNQIEVEHLNKTIKI